MAEETVARYYESNGYQILERNFTIRGGEIDLIAQKENEIHFIEVKARHSFLYGRPEEAVDVRKRQRLRKAARYYLLKHPVHFHATQNYIFDVVEVDLAFQKLHVIMNAFGEEE